MKFKLKMYVESVISTLKYEYKNKGYKITVDIEEDLEIDSYPSAFSQIFTNLIINSIIHGFKHRNDGLITITASVTDDVLHVIYEDDGMGISSENLKKIFEPFFTTNREDGGSGLGMNVIYNIVKDKLNGTIKCISESNKEVLFKIYIPMNYKSNE